MKLPDFKYVDQQILGYLFLTLLAVLGVGVYAWNSMWTNIALSSCYRYHSVKECEHQLTPQEQAEANRHAERDKELNMAATEARTQRILECYDKTKRDSCRHIP